MATNLHLQCLRNIAIFQGLNPLQISEIARRAQRIVYRPGQTIIEEDDVSNAAILIIAGDAVRISGPTEKPEHEFLSPGALIGEMSMLVETQHSSTILARGEVRALHICRDDLVEQMQEDPRIADHFMKVLTGRLSTIAHELRSIESGLHNYAPPPQENPTAHIH